MTTVQDVDDITDEILGLLIQEPNFIKEWELRTMEAIEQEKRTTKQEEKLDELTITIEELIHVVDLAIQSFLDVEKHIYRFTDPALNPDASGIFAVELQMQRLELHPNLQRILSSARRINQLARKFPTRLSNGCHVPNVLKLATSVCGMLFRLEENLRTLKGSSDISVTLARCASDFNRMVVEKLEKWKEQLDREKKKKDLRPTTPVSKPQLRRPLSQLQHRSPGGFLMSPELAKARQTMARSRSATPGKQRSGRQSMPPTDPDDRLQRRRDLADSMQKKWGNLLKIDQVLQRSLPQKGTRDSDDDPATLRVAKRISAQVIRDLRKSFGDHPPLILTASNHI